MIKPFKKIKSSWLLALLLIAGAGTGHAQETTTVHIKIPEFRTAIDPMIYGQMLENVNDSMIYGGVADLSGNVRKHLIPMLRDLQIPVMRWPGGTVIYEYHWQKGIGPRKDRPTVATLAWNGKENYQFGTDEFLQWSKMVGTTPYINLNMSMHPDFKATITDALNWIEYVNGDLHTPYGKMRAGNGHAAPYNVKYWCIGNENYLVSRAGRIQETDAQYALRLKQWAGAIRSQYPELKLLGIGRSLPWNQTVLKECGQLVDFLTQHYYVNAQLKDEKIQNPANTLFSPAKMETHLALLGKQLATINKELGREANPVRLSVDEWNNRHAVSDGEKFKFSRPSLRRQFDVAVVAGMLNAFIRQSPHVGMANYIFPVNAHGLIRTVGNTDAYKTPIYHVFKQYREQLVGTKLDVSLQGPSIASAELKPTITGDSDETEITAQSLTYVDAAAVLNDDKTIHLSLVNRSHDKKQIISVEIPKGYKGKSLWKLTHSDINAANSPENRNNIVPSTTDIQTKKDKWTAEIPPCGLYILKLVPAG